MLVKEILKPAVTVDDDTSLVEAAKIMDSKNVKKIFVVEKNELVGIVSQEDLVKHFGHKEMVKEIMVKKTVSVSSSQDSSEALRLMNKYKLDMIPVIDNKKIVGVVLKGGEDSEKDSDFLFE